MNKWWTLYQNPATGRGRRDAGEPSLARLFAELRREVGDEAVIRAMEHVPRELFLPPEARALAYANEALPIGEGQTISQPLIVALMTSALALGESDKVLELGTGSGYQAAVLSKLAGSVVSVERKPRLAETARRRLAAMGIRNVTVHNSARALGWPAEGPYDAILVTAAAPRVPPGLIGQLGDGGRLVIPIGPRESQELVKASKRDGKLTVHRLGGCRFVPLVGAEAWEHE